MTLEEIKNKALSLINNISDPEQLEEWRVKFLGRKSDLTQILRSLVEKSIEEKRAIGSAANVLRQELESLFNEKLTKLKANEAGEANALDITRPGRRVEVGHLHPLTLVEQEIRQIFSGLNFSVVDGPELETDYYNFDALNIPKDHPARDMWDTLWLQGTQEVSGFRFQVSKKKKSERLLMRTHTSPVQVRYMETHEPPFQIIVPGRVFRYEATDASHEINFYQFEGLMVGPDVSLANFKFIITEFFKKFFRKPVAVRFRPSFFPFVEPGIEIDIKLDGRWLEVMGAGMVHPNVLKAVKYNPIEVRGFAFGGGIDRFAMIKYGIPDIRLFYNSDLRFIKQF